MRFIVVMPLRPRPSLLNLLLNDRADFFSAFSDDYHASRYQVFNSPFQSRRYIEQNSVDSFLALSFARNLLDVLMNQNSFFHALERMTYHAPRVPQRQIRFQPSYDLFDEDRSFLAGQVSSFGRDLMTADKIPVRALPANAKLPSGMDYNAEGILDVVTLDRSKDLVCVKTAVDSNQNPMYQVYDRRSLFEVYARNHGSNGSFKDPNTNQVVSIKDVFRISSYDAFSQHMRNQNKPVVLQASPAPVAPRSFGRRVGA